jgi:hypothetical protein
MFRASPASGFSVEMTALGIALIVAGLTLVCGSMIFRLFARLEPAFSEESFEKDCSGSMTRCGENQTSYRG